MALIRIPVPNAGGYVLEFDSDAIVQIETPREMRPSPDGLGHMEFSGGNSLILRFATLDDAPTWVEPQARGCRCEGDCEGGPECLDDEGGPLR